MKKFLDFPRATAWGVVFVLLFVLGYLEDGLVVILELLAGPTGSETADT